MTWVRKHKIMVGNLGLIVVMLLGFAYLGFGSLRWQPFTSNYSLTIHFPNSGGLQGTSDVTLRGARIGEVASIQTTPTTVDVRVRVESDVKINRNTIVAARGLSAAGEQYVDFQPPTADGPYLNDGDTINVNQTKVTVPFSSMLESTLGVVDQIDPVKLASIVDELDLAVNRGDNQLKALFDSGGEIFRYLYDALPETTSLIQNTGTILKTTAGIQPDFATLTSGAESVINSLVASDKEIRTLLGRGPNQLTSLTGSLNQVRDPLSDLIKQFRDVARQGALRAPALANLMPSIRDGSVQAIKMFHDGAWWALASLYPRPSCNYSVTPTRPTKVLELTVPVNLYCVTQDKNQQIRGSANAPRPAGDDTAGPPPNYDPNARTVPLDK
ncbi:Mce family protein [Gordonia effusa NBRC 100432]|uniref:Mce family protein n=1 Tax=Gordonia effusa NBRC 100432 TaxID=1077974 RepID=H0R164_9ACTN|nr:MlaD family protein [Gordonia effusa]GAB18815.1 Mce family protein [Gordonia effusa NBRC 100432]